MAKKSKPSKADKIRKLAITGLDVRKIAKRVDCRVNYVKTVIALDLERQARALKKSPRDDWDEKDLISDRLQRSLGL